ncbi:glycosyl transferases group 1 domain-containing protein [Ditylenchus destructor]|uniref:GDP-Man:Man(3)GlcNAc(2)-PP-Dol alpha-1,2-mannosyltransferase n=1 Tax=Ditylenchus destructor TaxID=166010 RepID=A0AAD4R5P2_9BILA|nr:glycosyl transferases group 1 domain-containing protein [Ditylenchus destructor]
MHTDILSTEESRGGGERVLWRAISSMQKKFSKEKFRYVVFTGDTDATPDEILQKVKSRFNITLSNTGLDFIFLRYRWLLEAKNYSRFTLLLQMVGQYVLGFEALLSLNPQIFVDTTGCPLSLPLFRLIAGSKVVAYVHYPTITTEMIDMVGSRKESYNNAGQIASSSFLTACKILYYKDFSWLYWFCGQCADIVMTNGSWTNNHIKKLWSGHPKIVYPPCDVDELTRIEDKSEHILTNENCLRILAEVRNELAKMGRGHLKVKLLIAGGCRDEDDYKRVEFLRNYARESLKLDNKDDIEWHLNVSYKVLLQLFQDSLIGIHTMWNEHFGISVVEGLASGTIMVAHDSGGPKLDIVGGYLPSDNQKTDENSETVCGFLASTKGEYAEKILSILEMTPEQRSAIRQNAKESALRFSNEEFDERFCESMAQMIAIS